MVVSRNIVIPKINFMHARWAESRTSYQLCLSRPAYGADGKYEDQLDFTSKKCIRKGSRFLPHEKFQSRPECEMQSAMCGQPLTMDQKHCSKENQLETFEMWTIRQMFKITGQGTFNKSRSIRAILWKLASFFGHVMRYDSFERDLLEVIEEGNGSRCRPILQWRDTINYNN